MSSHAERLTTGHFTVTKKFLEKGTIDINEKKVAVVAKDELDTTDDAAGTDAVAETIKNLGLDIFCIRKLTLNEVLSIDPYETERKMKHTLTELPVVFIKQLMSANSDALDLSIYNLDYDMQESESSQVLKGSISAIFDSVDKSHEIAPLDLLLLTYQCCNSEVKQVFIQKLYLCKLAVPFIYHDWFSKKEMVCVWPLRTLLMENKFNQNFSSETEVLKMPTRIVSFARFGRPLYSKSKLLNGIVCDFNADTFFNKDCQAGLAHRYATNGYAEIFWLPIIGDERSQFAEPMTFINLRGDVACNCVRSKLNCIASLSDMFVILVDIDDVLTSTEIVQNLLVRFHLVLLIICSPIEQKHRGVLERFVCNVQERAGTKLHVLCTHIGKIEKNQRDLCVEIAKAIAECINSTSNKPVTLQSRLKRIPDNLKTDEDDDCVHAKQSAKQLILEMSNQSPQEPWSKNVTPVQFIHSNKLGNLLKAMYSKKEKKGYAEIKKEVSNVKEMQTNHVTEPVKLFIKLVMHYNDKSESLHYFLSWLKLFVERKKRQTMVELNHYHQNLWGTYTKLKRETKDISKIKEYENKTQESERTLEEASFGVANFFREIAHLYDAFISIGKDLKSIELPEVQVMATVCANLFINGHIFELLDGNSLYMTTLWNAKVLEVVHEKISKKKVLALSVLGLQSSGKSTLLNTMFGVQFTASSGRCTRGIHAQLVPLNLNGHTLESKQFEYLLIIDTEGLRAPELKENNYKRDNELATIIIGLGDITILNVMGENTAEIRDVLQTIVHAFLRLKLANPKVDIAKSCIFIHQNVSDVSASEKMKAGLQVSVEVLDNVTKESAESEGISHITTFDQVIRFNVDNDVWYLPNLWKGNPPLAQINRKYSQRVVGINHELLKRALANTEKSYKSLKDIVIHTEDLWKGVLAEDFVFSFRNSLEKKAFIALEKKMKDELWNIEKSVDEILYKLCREKFSKCDTCEKLSQQKTGLKTDIQAFIGTQTSTVHKCIEEYFDKNDYKDTTVQWKEQTLNKLQMFSSDLYNKKQPEIENMLKRRECDIIMRSKHAHTEEALRQKSVDLAVRLRGQNSGQEVIESEFEKIWTTFVKDLFVSKDTETISSLKNFFVQRLIQQFNHPVLNTVLEQHNMLDKRLKITRLSGSFDLIGITLEDLSLKSTWHKIFTKISLRDYTLKALKSAKRDLEKALCVADEKVAKLNMQDDEITDSDIGNFFHEVYDVIENSLNKTAEHYSVTTAFYVKVMVFVSNVALTSFEKHNEEYHIKYGVKAKLQKYKIQCRELFDAHLNDRRKEEKAGIPFRHAVKKYIRDAVFDSMSMKAKQELKPLLPSSKYGLIVKILTDLVQLDSFKVFMRYIKHPKSYAEKWITTESEKLLFGVTPSKMYQKASEEKHMYVSDLRTVIVNSASAFSDMPRIQQWIDYLNNNTKSCKFPKEILNDVKNEFGESSLVDVEYFKNTLLDEIVKLDQELDIEFKSFTAATFKWRNYNPYDIVFTEIWGCVEECMFCGEPCRNSMSNHSGLAAHTCLQHRPKGLLGTHRSNSNEISVTTCNYAVSSKRIASCGVFRYACNATKKEKCTSEYHPYKDYKTFYPNWDIEPAEDMEETSKFWYWFIGKYKQELANEYDIEVTNVPDRWSSINITDALESLKKLYN